MKNEIWKDVAGYVGYYEVSNYGKVRSVDRYVNNHKGERALRKGKVLTDTLDDKGYVRYTFRMGKSKKMKRGHRLVAEAFIPNPNQYTIINHKDGNKANNHISNLEWCTHRQNSQHAESMGLVNHVKGSNHHKATITEDTVRAMRKLYAEGNHTQKQIAEEFSVHLSKAKHILAGRTWKHVV
jgi:hypothetical protein